jgi:hypothetical protein
MNYYLKNSGMNRARSLTSRFLTVLCFAAVLGGCASTSLVNQWKNPTVTPRAYEKFLVVGVANDITLRRAYENLLVEDLQKLGVNAVKSIDYLPQDLKPSREQVKGMVKECGADAVITTRAASVKDETVYLEGFRDIGYVAGSASSSNPNSDFYMFYAGVVDMPAAQDMQTAILETRLFDVKSSALVWVASTSSFDSDRQFKAIHDLAQLIATTLRKEGYLKPGP